MGKSSDARGMDLPQATPPNATKITLACRNPTRVPQVFGLRPAPYSLGGLWTRSETHGTIHTFIHIDKGDMCKCFKIKEVEVRGFEPLAFSLRTRRSTN